MPDVVEPGTRLVERYRLDERLGGPAHGEDLHAPGQGEAATYWRAHDELLQRSVGVCLLPAGDEQAGLILRAARKAAVLTDPRFLRVLDASEVDGVVYVVSEWVSATPLLELLTDGSLPAGEARAMAIEIAGALAAAHQAGLAHLCLSPEHVLRTARGEVRLAGLGVDAAARGITVAEPAEAAARDTQAAAAVLYASLTARWPDGITGTASALPPAPLDGTDLCSPRQVRAGVPDDLDAVACRALDVPGRHGGSPLRTPDELATALAATQGTARLPVPGVAPPPVRETPSASAAYVAPFDDPGVPRRRSRATAVAWALAVLVLVAGLALAGAQLMTTDLGGADDAPGQQQDDTGTEPSGSPSGDPIKVATATTFDPLPDGNGEENTETALLAVDENRSTAWRTETYKDPFGPNGLKDGVGLLLDLGSVRDVSRVTVRVQSGGTDLEVRVADELGSALDDYRPVETARNVDRRTEVRPDEPVRARYVLIWLTSLPSLDGGYRGEVLDVTVDG